MPQLSFRFCPVERQGRNSLAEDANELKSKGSNSAGGGSYLVRGKWKQLTCGVQNRGKNWATCDRCAKLKT